MTRSQRFIEFSTTRTHQVGSSGGNESPYSVYRIGRHQRSSHGTRLAKTPSRQYERLLQLKISGETFRFTSGKRITKRRSRRTTSLASNPFVSVTLPEMFIPVRFSSPIARGRAFCIFQTSSGRARSRQGPQQATCGSRVPCWCSRRCSLF